MAPKTRASLSCHTSIFMLFSAPCVTSVHRMYKPCATEIRFNVVAVCRAFNAVMQRSKSRVHGWLISGCIRRGREWKHRSDGDAR